MQRLLIFSFLLFVLPLQLSAADFSFYQHQGKVPGATLLVIGGVDGDEPGAFHAAASLVTHYQIEKGHLWIVPNLNAAAILKRQRGDMNLKFASVAKSDPDYLPVQRIQNIITRPQVDLVLNLHDGSGFYHPQRISSQRSPYRWGQSCVIDQSSLKGPRFGNLQKMAETTIQHINQKVASKDHYFQLKNVRTRTAKEDIPAKKSLSYFAVRHNKPAFAVEASKTDPVHLRTYFHLLALESLMRQMDINFTRDFPLSPEAVRQLIKDDALISLADGRIQLDLNNMRPTLNNFPLPLNKKPVFNTNNPLISLQPDGQRYRVHYGNNRLAFLQPEYIELDHSIASVPMSIDGLSQQISFGSIIPVTEEFKVNVKDGYRVNVIGFARPGQPDDGHVKIRHSQLNRKYSIDKSGLLYRVEIYRQERFSGMVLVDFRPRSAKKEPLVAQATPVNLKSGERHN
ncbi:MAG: M14/M99 family metallopeptidase [Deltaproteobacteria bacterium]|nr:M14/M99 family metallopeptidase [Deltaproteobacteria bacterium]